MVENLGGGGNAFDSY